MNSTYAASKLCRACLSDHEDMQDIFQTCFVEVFEYCTSLQVSVNDGLPSALCGNCVGLLNTSYYFKQQCIRSDETLKQIIVAPQVNNYLINQDTELRYTVEIPALQDTEYPIDDKYSPKLVKTSSELELSNSNYDQNSIQEVKQLPITSDDTNNGEMRLQNQDAIVIPQTFSNEAYSNTFQTFESMQSFEKKISCETETPECTVANNQLLDVKSTKAKVSKGHMECPKCDKIFKTSHRLDAHIRQHLGLKPFVCKTCDKEFSYWRTLKMHTDKHKGEKNYKCDVCTKAFTYSTTLSSHKKTHTGVRNYSCEKCDAKFVQPAHLKAHMSRHSADKPYPCQQCSKTFKSLANLKAHLDRHKGIKNYVCSICGKRFPTNGELTVHMRSHNSEKKFKCSQCNNAYKCKSLLVSHLRTHASGESSFKCSVCSRKFKDAQLLNRHSGVHTKLASNNCNICYKFFGGKLSLLKHLRCHKKDFSKEPQIS